MDFVKEILHKLFSTYFVTKDELLELQQQIHIINNPIEAKHPFNKQVWCKVWPEILKAPETAISKDLMVTLVNFNIEEASDIEVYDFLTRISEEGYAHHQISEVMRTLFDVTRFYERPS